ncbi:DUF4400 domain-containing protein [Pseudomonas sp. R1-18]
MPDVPAGVAPWVVYQEVPVSVSPMLVLLPCTVVLGLLMNVTVGSFKKYL